LCPALRIIRALLRVEARSLSLEPLLLLLLELGTIPGVVACLEQALSPLLLDRLLVQLVVRNVDQREARRLLHAQ
jgi:hypothetical protein